MRLVSVVKGETQVVAGINYRIVLEAGVVGAKVNVYEAVVWEKEWEKFRKLISFDLRLGRLDEQFVEKSVDSNTTNEISMLKRTKKASLVSNEAPIDKGIEVSVPIEPGKVQKRREIRHGKAGSETTFVQENSNANGTKRVDLSQEKEMVKSSVDSQINLNINAKDAIDLRIPPTVVTGIVD
ncbi:hypothetical protein ZIOFF_015179 [Zingiber officinale]|uniref:Cystatin domain-containing protein n=1 Tax=Zingiber officinale TaxID=94328 RepID=A0A8J5LQ23_ZINOF|nr:hypothetical protein ZIOFF_015179 [Zingiber officinale]